METDDYKPGIEQLGSSVKVNPVPAVQVTSVLPSFTASALEQVTSTTVPGFTGNCVVVSIVLVHSVFNPVHISTATMFRVRDRLLDVNLLIKVPFVLLTITTIELNMSQLREEVIDFSMPRFLVLPLIGA